jgi:hypothetical protein
VRSAFGPSSSDVKASEGDASAESKDAHVLSSCFEGAQAMAEADVTQVAKPEGMSPSHAVRARPCSLLARILLTGADI